jgi:hypothetical protein
MSSRFRSRSPARPPPHPTKAPLTPTLSHSASKTRVNALMLRAKVRGRRVAARGEREPTELAAPLCLIVTKLSPFERDLRLKQRVVAASACSQDPQMTCRRP